MSTKSNRSAGTQHNLRGIAQGNTLVGPKSGLPIDEVVDGDGVRRLAVDANVSIGSATINVDIDYLDGDSTAIGDPNTSTLLKINTDGSIDANVKVNATDGDNIAISDGTDTLAVNSDGSINIAPLTTPNIANVTTILADTEYFYTFPANTRKFFLKCRGNAKLQISYILGQTGINYITTFPGNKHEEIDLKVTGFSIYFQSNKAGEVVEIRSWS
mgnify:CR=1 FL=1